MHFVSALAHYSDQYESVLMYFNLSKLKTSNPVAKNGVIWILLKYDTNHENLVRRLKSAEIQNTCSLSSEGVEFRYYSLSGVMNTF